MDLRRLRPRGRHQRDPLIQIGLTAPPIGLNVFVISALAKAIPITETYRGVMPFILADIIRLALCVAFPALSLWLVRLLN